MTITVFVLFILCECSYIGQTFFNKLFSGAYDGPKAAVSPVFACIYGFVVAVITLALNGLVFEPSSLTIELGVINGAVLFIYNVAMIQSGRRGPYSFQSIVMLFGGTVVCLFVSAIIWGDDISAIKYVGTIVMLISFVVLNFGGLDFSNVKKGYYLWTFSLFFSNGIYGVLMDAQQRMIPAERNEMIIITFGSSGILSLIYLLIVQKGKLKEAFTMSKKSGMFAMISSVSAAFAIFLLMILLSYIPSYILYTIDNGIILIMSEVLSAIVLKEKMGKQAAIGIAIAAVGIVLLGI